jgi:hypothetical protein
MNYQTRALSYNQTYHSITCQEGEVANLDVMIHFDTRDNPIKEQV